MHTPSSYPGTSRPGQNATGVLGADRSKTVPCRQRYDGDAVIKPGSWVERAHTLPPPPFTLPFWVGWTPDESGSFWTSPVPLW